jgi:hypothetical protein
LPQYAREQVMCDACFRLTLQIERLSRLIALGGHGRISIVEAETYLDEIRQQLASLKRSHEEPSAVRP